MCAGVGDLDWLPFNGWWGEAFAVSGRGGFRHGRRRWLCRRRIGTFLGAGPQVGLRAEPGGSLGWRAAGREGFGIGYFLGLPFDFGRSEGSGLDRPGGMNDALHWFG